MELGLRSDLKPVSPVPDLVRISKIETQFHRNPDSTQHIKYVSASAFERRRVRKEERWSRERRLGRGSSGDVWLEECIEGDEKGQVRAVKEVQKLEGQTYYRELEAIALFSNAQYEHCFVKSFGWYENDESVFITMEHLPNGDLHRYLGITARPLPELEGRTIISQVLEGLAFMHQNGFTHRDLKPANLLIVHKGPDWWVKIADFGISKRATEGLTALRTLTGTPAFAAPEVLGFAQADSYTNAVDIWSLGVIGFLIFTGETLFRDQRRLGQYVRGSFTFPANTLVANEISSEGCNFIRNSMEPMPQDRPSTDESLLHPWFGLKLASTASNPQGVSSRRSSLAGSTSPYDDIEATAKWSTYQDLTHRPRSPKSSMNPSFHESSTEDNFENATIESSRLPSPSASLKSSFAFNLAGGTDSVKGKEVDRGDGTLRPDFESAKTSIDETLPNNSQSRSMTDEDTLPVGATSDVEAIPRTHESPSPHETYLEWNGGHQTVKDNPATMFSLPPLPLDESRTPNRKVPVAIRMQYAEEDSIRDQNLWQDARYPQPIPYKDNKRRTIQTEYVAPRSQIFRDEPAIAAAPSGSTVIRAHTGSQGPVEEDGGEKLTPRKRTSISAPTGLWILGKTIGTGQSSKVKLAKISEGPELVAVKIIPRNAPDDIHQNRADRERTARLSEIRTAREAAILTLFHHPYICGVRDVVRTTYNWYLLLEFIDGDQMLDYIISHGRLSEKKARKFCRQIASALDYAHHNSISHRDLRLENVLITRSGDVKIIDFGDCNFFEADNNLKTFCGWKYYVAPEVLAGVEYQGPSVDIWQFGIILYTLVCGKVPFDDPSTPKLYEKIKNGNPDLPKWLTVECMSLINRMLITNPSQRAILQEVMNHTWMIKGFGSPPENYLPGRKSIALPLDPEVIAAMTGFNFGPPEVIEAQLATVIESNAYQISVSKAAAQEEIRAQSYSTTTGNRKSFLGLKLGPTRDILANPSTPALNTLGVREDPFNAFHPLLSIYYLVREKQDRERTRMENLIRKSNEAVPIGIHTAGIYSDVAVDGPEIGTLVVVIDRAKNLPNRKTIGKQDPYCAAKLGKEARKTATDRRGGQTPRWDQELRFTVYDSPDYYQLKVMIFNDDKKTDLIGESWVSLKEVIKQGGGQKDIWQHLSCKGKYAGEVRIEITYYDSRPRQ